MTYGTWCGSATAATTAVATMMQAVRHQLAKSCLQVRKQRSNTRAGNTAGEPRKARIAQPPAASALVHRTTAAAEAGGAAGSRLANTCRHFTSRRLHFCVSSGSWSWPNPGCVAPRAIMLEVPPTPPTAVPIAWNAPRVAWSRIAAPLSQCRVDWQRAGRLSLHTSARQLHRLLLVTW